MDHAPTLAGFLRPLAFLVAIALVALAAFRIVGPSPIGVVPPSHASATSPSDVLPLILRLRAPDGSPIEGVELVIRCRGDADLAPLEPGDDEPTFTNSVRGITGGGGEVRMLVRPGARLEFPHTNLRLPDGLTTVEAFNDKWVGSGHESLQVPTDLAPGVAHIVEIETVPSGSVIVVLRSSSDTSPQSGRVRLWATHGTDVPLQQDVPVVTRHTFTSVPAGSYAVLVGRSASGTAPPPRRIEVTAGSTTGVDIDLAPGAGRIVGQLLDETGAPYTKIPIDVGYLGDAADWWPRGRGESTFLNPVIRTQRTDEQGRFEFTGLFDHPQCLRVGMALFDVHDPTTVPLADGVFLIDVESVDGTTDLGTIVKTRR